MEEPGEEPIGGAERLSELLKYKTRQKKKKREREKKEEEIDIELDPTLLS